MHRTWLRDKAVLNGPNKARIMKEMFLKNKAWPDSLHLTILPVVKKGTTDFTLYVVKGRVHIEVVQMILKACPVKNVVVPEYLSTIPLGKCTLLDAIDEADFGDGHFKTLLQKQQKEEADLYIYYSDLDLANVAMVFSETSFAEVNRLRVEQNTKPLTRTFEFLETERRLQKQGIGAGVVTSWAYPVRLGKLKKPVRGLLRWLEHDYEVCDFLLLLSC